RSDLERIAAGETMVETVDKISEEHERNGRLFLVLVSGLRGVERGAAAPAAVTESFLLKLLSLSGFHPSLTACAVCGMREPTLFASGQGGALCAVCADPDAGPVSPAALSLLASLANADLVQAGRMTAETSIRRESRALLFGFAEYHL